MSFTMVVATNFIAINHKLNFRKALTPGIDPAPTSRRGLEEEIGGRRGHRRRTVSEMLNEILKYKTVIKKEYTHTQRLKEVKEGHERAM